MSYAYGQNSQSSILLFENRKFYDTDILPLNSFEPTYLANKTFIDIFVEKPFYGRIDDSSFSVVSGQKINLNRSMPVDTLPFDDSKYIKKFKDADVFAMNFIVDAFNDMANFYNSTCQLLPELVKENILLSISPKIGWSSPIQAYKNYIEDIAITFLDEYYSINEDQEIKNFETFIKTFLIFLKNRKGAFSVIFSDFMLSRGANILRSGLCVEIADEEHGDDYIKTTSYLGSKSYSHLIESSRRYGFFIDRRAPWRLIANLSSTSMIAYMDRYGFNSLNEMFKKQFIRSSELDLFLLRDSLINIYSIVVNDKPNFLVIKENKCGTNTQEIPRDLKDKKYYYQKYPLQSWLNVYITLRSESVMSKMNEEFLKKIQLEAKQLYISKNLQSALEYIDNKFNTYGDLLLKKQFFTTKYESAINTNTNEPTT